MHYLVPCSPPNTVDSANPFALLCSADVDCMASKFAHFIPWIMANMLCLQQCASNEAAVDFLIKEIKEFHKNSLNN
jgi:hypothetical protein